MKTEDLLKNLGRDPAPVRRLSRRSLFIAGAGMLLFYILLLVVFSLRIRADLAEKAGSLSFAGILAIPLVLGAAGLWLAVKTSLAERWPRRWRWIGIPLLAYGGASAWYSFSGVPVLSFGQAEWGCALFIFYLSLPVWVLSLSSVFVAHPEPFRFERAVGILAWSAGAFIMNAHCPYDGHGHQFWGHAVIPLALAFVAFLPLAALYRVAAKGIVRARTSRLARRLGR